MAQRSWDEIVDVVVVGSGGAALAAALAASVGGAEVLVLEKADQLGGTTAVSGGVVWVPCNPHMERLGASDTRERALAYLRELAKGSAPDESLFEVFVDTAAEAIAFLEEHSPLEMFATRGFADYYHPYGVPGATEQGRALEPTPFPVGKQLPEWRSRIASRISMQTLGGFTTLEEDLSWAPVDQELVARRAAEDIRPKGAALVAGIFKGLLDRDVDTRLGARVRELASDDGAIVGLRYERAGTSRWVGARQGVVLACGGFEWNRELVDAHIGYELHPVSPPHNEGDGLLLSMRAGAQLANMGSYWGTGVMYDPTVADENGPIAQFDVARGMPGSLIVDQSGRRFVNEAVPYNDFPRAFGAFDPLQVDFAHRAPAWQIVDHELKETFPMLSMEPGKPPPEWVPHAASARELATLLGVDPDAFEATLARFNQFAADGEDPDFRRHEIGLQHAAKPRPLTPPLYAIAIYPGTLGTNGGPRIDADARVARAGGGSVPGLYAAGNAAANAFGWAYPSGGGTLANAIAFGYRAGRHAAAQPRRAS